LIYFQFLLAALILSIQPQKNIQVAIWKIINKQKNLILFRQIQIRNQLKSTLTKNKESIGIAEELVVQILEKLNHFESTNEYLHLLLACNYLLKN
jgi:hypothetical protein